MRTVNNHALGKNHVVSSGEIVLFYQKRRFKLRPHKKLGRYSVFTVIIWDIVNRKDNLVEKKHHRLARSERSDLLDRDLKPNATDRDYLHNMVHVNPPTYIPNSEEQDLIWKFRFHLSTDRHALVIFLRCINWETKSEVRQALTLMNQWEPMSGSDALALLSPDFTQQALRQYAIARLHESSDDELLLYLLQLVQALKYENNVSITTLEPDVIQSMDDTINPMDNQDAISKSAVITNSQEVSSLTSSSIAARPDTPDPDAMYASDTSVGHMSDTEPCLSTNIHNNNASNTLQRSKSVVQIMQQDFVPTSLSSFLIHRACCNPTLTNYLYWYLHVECDTSEEHAQKPDLKVLNMYDDVLRSLKRTLEEGTLDQRIRLHSLHRQQLLIDELVKLVKDVKAHPGNYKKKAEFFEEMLATSGKYKVNFMHFEPIPFPLDPSVLITGIKPVVRLFKSAMLPSKLTFKTTSGTDYTAIFKCGDDLRQDQLIMQMIKLMDKLLRCENLDLKLTPYRVMATGAKNGFMQYIESVTVNEACSEEGSVQNFLRRHNPCVSAPYGIAPEVLDTYIKSCAGYCVITYLLGVGDRHLDNLLLTTSGNLFHIDFGFILGRDPKPMPPPMKISKEMVEAMGGLQSDEFMTFRKTCFTTYLHLRRQSKVMLNLFALMVDASVPDIALEPDKAVKKVEENLKMGLSDEMAIQHLQNVIIDSVSALMPVMLDQFHKIAQYLRR